MDQANFKEARKAEANYHNELYQEHDILESGTWMSEPNQIVMNLLDQLLESKKDLHVLDLGCGAGRNTIPVATRLQGTDSQVIAIDLLGTAIAKLRENANKYDVSNIIQVEECDVEYTTINESQYDYIMACGCLEHVSSEDALLKVIERMKRGTVQGGIHCITINTAVTEVETDSGKVLEPLIELNLSTERAMTLLETAYRDWSILEKRTDNQSIDEEKYDVPTQFRTVCISFAVQKVK
ncbi:class I SAM-dependent methyltransferase [Paenibacillus sp. CMAA1364]